MARFRSSHRRGPCFRCVPSCFSFFGGCGKPCGTRPQIARDPTPSHLPGPGPFALCCLWKPDRGEGERGCDTGRRTGGRCTPTGHWRALRIPPAVVTRQASQRTEHEKRTRLTRKIGSRTGDSSQPTASLGRRPPLGLLSGQFPTSARPVQEQGAEKSDRRRPPLATCLSWGANLLA